MIPLNEIIKISKEANKQQLEIIKKYNKNREIKKINQSNRKIRKFLQDQNINPESPLFKIFQKGKNNLKSDANVIDGGSGDNIAFINMENPYLGTINNIQAFNQMTV